MKNGVSYTIQLRYKNVVRPNEGTKRNLPAVRFQDYFCRSFCANAIHVTTLVLPNFSNALPADRSAGYGSANWKSLSKAL